jgi:hypothetical protein
VGVEKALQVAHLVDLLVQHFAILRLRFVKRLDVGRAFAQPQFSAGNDPIFFRI